MEAPLFSVEALPNGEIDTEPVLVEVEGDTVRMLLWDGRTLTFDRTELALSLGSSITPSTAD